MTKISVLHRRWSKDRDYKGAYDALGEEFDLARALIEARTAAGLSQSATSQHLARMREEGIVDFRREGQILWYRIAEPRTELLLGYLQKLYCRES